MTGFFKSGTKEVIAVRFLSSFRIASVLIFLRSLRSSKQTTSVATSTRGSPRSSICTPLFLSRTTSRADTLALTYVLLPHPSSNVSHQHSYHSTQAGTNMAFPPLCLSKLSPAMTIESSIPRRTPPPIRASRGAIHWSLPRLRWRMFMRWQFEDLDT
jgi:hypothetical protein